MSVKTTADELLEEARDNIRNASVKLHKVIDPETWGSKDFKEEYRKKILDSFIQLIKIEEDLK